MTRPADTGRYRVVRQIGQGGMGAVYLADDAERGARVALKTLRGMPGDVAARLKREFRALADVSHPNLVAMYELVSSGEQWFFTMEYVAGVRFDVYVGADAPRATVSDAVAPRTGIRTVALPTTMAAATTHGTDGDAQRDAPPARRAMPAADLTRLRRTMAQLARGIAALHRAGVLHRDLKPSNVLVDEAGRVVVLDFGLATDRAPRVEGTDANERIVIEGTPQYMAPEQAAGQPARAASDWYAFGVMLYEALAGRLPFEGAQPSLVLIEKQVFEAPRLVDVVDGAPADLVTLCERLLRRDPDERPLESDVLAAFDPDRVDAGPRVRTPFASDATERVPLAGREIELAALRAALSDDGRDGPIVVEVQGDAGLGKSTLIRAALSSLRTTRPDALVLAGRCYEREDVPFKAFDAVADALARHLDSLPIAARRALAPRGAHQLGQLFPALRELADGALPDAPSDDQAGARQMAFAALRDVLRALCAHGRVVVFVDDAHWADDDSARLLSSLLAEPDAPPVRWLFAWRGAEGARSAFVQMLATLSVPRRSVTVGRLEPQVARALARALLGNVPGAEARAERLATESEGHPYFLAELASEGTREGAGSLEALLRERTAALPADARTVLDHVVVAGRPLGQATLARAVGDAATLDRALAALRAAHLVRTTGTRATDTAEPFHDRVRETLIGTLDDAARRRCHRALAEALGADAPDVEALADHWAGAGETDRARAHTERAALRARAAMAFEHAARLYARAAGWTHGETRAAIRTREAECLVLAGRAADAAPVYLAAAGDSTGRARLELQRNAAEQFLKSGHVDQGVAVLREVLAPVGVRYPATPREALLRAGVGLVRVRLRGVAMEERAASQQSPVLQAQADACAAAGRGLILVDPVRGFGFLNTFLLRSLEIGDPRRLAQALAMNAISHTRRGADGYATAMTWMARASAIAERYDDAVLRAQIAACQAGVEVAAGHWRAVHPAAERAMPLLRACGMEASWESAACWTTARAGLLWCGELATLRTVVAEQRAAARRLGNHFVESFCRVHGWFVAAQDDDPMRGLADLDQATGAWSSLGFHAIHFWALYGAMQLDVYRGDPASAVARWDANARGVGGSQILGMQVYRAVLVQIRGAARLALAARSRGRDREALLTDVAHDARALAGERTMYASAAAAALRAGSATARGDASRARVEWDRAIVAFDAAEMKVHAACARIQRDALASSAHTARAAADAVALLEREGIRAPARWAAMYAPTGR